MSWPFAKRDPSKNLGAYYVQITNDELDFDDPIIQGIRESLGGLPSWPELSMVQLKGLTEGLQEQLAKSKGEVAQLGTVNYIVVDPDTGKAQETGLTWDDARILPSMENFVIETVSQVLNDGDVRMDDDATYDQIANALTQLIAAAEELGGFSADDLPKLPTLEEYTTAVETNQKLVVKPLKLVKAPETLSEEPHQKIPDEVKDESGSFDAKATPLPLTDNSAAQGGAPTVPTGAPEAISPQQAVHSEIASTSAGVSAPLSDEPTKSVSTESTLVDKINQFQVSATGFKVETALADRVVSPEDDAYIDVMMAREKLTANDLLRNSASKQTAAVQKQLLRTVSDAQLNNEALDELLSNDWQTPIKQGITQKHTKAFADRLAGTHQNLSDAYTQDVNQENARHEAALAELKRQFESDTTKATTQSDVQRDQLIQAEMAQAISQQTLYIDREVAELRRKADDIITHHLADSMVDKAKSSDEFMSNELQSFVTALEARRAELVAEHEQALAKRQLADEAAANKAQAERENHDVVQLESSKRALETERTSLQERVVQLQSEATKWQNQAESNQTEMERLMQRLSETTQSEQQTALIAALAGHNQNDVEVKKSSHSFIKGALLSATILLGVGGVGAGAYYVTHTTTKAEASVKAAKASYNAKTVSLEKRLEKSEKSVKKTASDTSKSAASSQSVTAADSAVSSAVDDKTQTAVTASTEQNFTALDADVANGSLKTYYQSFENQNLLTDARTLAVGKLLVEMNNLSAAKTLAAANDGHNSELLSLINQKEVKG
ncbi:coiled-coil domain-containing protein [Weissella cibaria]|uniref:hypothetical protein n=1 Tax=Weissella cibaria TaxID=137591 RepID=UPI001194CEB4|nr:hypothetical protein [Weissella cibaria]TVV31829.1 hypothetical protein FO434_06105 [Weissella cibaria]